MKNLRLPRKLALNLALSLKGGAVGVLPTDTLYGIVGSAFLERSVERIYVLRKRRPDKPFIILISSLGDLKIFGVRLGVREGDILKKLWPGPVSVVLRSKSGKFDYLKRGGSTLAFRMPGSVWLRNLLKRSGPLVAPSANVEGKKPAKNVREAKEYFGDGVDFYVSVGDLVSKSSTLISLVGGKPRVLREGAFRGNLYVLSCSKR